MDRPFHVLEAPLSAPHPGEMVTDYLEHRSWAQSDLARRTGLTPKTISEICNGKSPISPSTALALEKVLQRPAQFWLGLQRLFDEAEARRREAEAAASWTTWVAKFPLKEMKRLGWIQPSPSKHGEVDRLLSFLGVTSPQSWEAVWRSTAVAYRQTRKFKTSAEAISVWTRATEIAVQELEFPVEEFDERALRSAIPDLRRQTTLRVDEVLQPVQELCARVGVAVVWVPALEHTGVSGCARWLSDKKAMIALTLRYGTDDQMWFTFFHELGHILLHKKAKSFVLDNAETSVTDGVVDPEMQKIESEANNFASDTLIPPASLTAFIALGKFTSETIFQFAQEVGIGPGVVVGRLQREGVLARHQGNSFKQKLSWGVTEADE